MRKAYVPVNLSEPENHGQDLEHQPQEQTAYVLPSTTISARNDNGQPILVAVAVPNSIRPPKATHEEEDPTVITVSSIIRRICILVIGLLLTCFTFFESLILMIYRYFDDNWFVSLLGLVWFGATLGVLVGSFIGAYRGQWRLLVPGLVLQHFVGVLTRLLVTDIDEDYYGYTKDYTN